MKDNSHCHRWTNQYSENLPLGEKEELIRHTETCLNCYYAYKGPEIHKVLQVTPNVKLYPDITFRQLLAQEQVCIEEQRRSIRKQDFVLASLYGLGFPFVLCTVPIWVWSQFIWPQFANLFEVFSNAPPFTGILAQTLVIYLINVITCRFTQTFAQAFFQKMYNIGKETQNKGKVDLNLCIKLTRHIGGVVVMCLSLLTSVIFVHNTGIIANTLIAPIVIGIVPYDIKYINNGELRIDAIFWGAIIKRFPHTSTRLERSPLLRQIEGVKESIKSLQWI